MRRMAWVAGLILLTSLTGCVSMAWGPPPGADRISNAWGSQTTAGMAVNGVPTAAAGGNAIH